MALKRPYFQVKIEMTSKKALLDVLCPMPDRHPHQRVFIMEESEPPGL